MVSYSSLLTRSPPSGGFMEYHWIILPVFLYVWKKYFFCLKIFIIKCWGRGRHRDIWPRFCLGEHVVGISQFRHKRRHQHRMWCHLCRLALYLEFLWDMWACKSGTLQKLLPTMCFRVLTRRWQCVGEDVCSTWQFRLHSARELCTQSLGPVFSSFSYIFKGNYCSNTS